MFARRAVQQFRGWPGRFFLFAAPRRCVWRGGLLLFVRSTPGTKRIL
jgi:hypothetical protein